MESKITKGEWKYSQVSENRICFENPTGIDLWSRIEDYGRIKETKEENEANAKAISAVPEMIDALKIAIEAYKELGLEPSQNCYKQAIAALNKAL